MNIMPSLWAQLAVVLLLIAAIAFIVLAILGAL